MINQILLQSTHSDFLSLRIGLGSTLRLGTIGREIEQFLINSAISSTWLWFRPLGEFINKSNKGRTPCKTGTEQSVVPNHLATVKTTGALINSVLRLGNLSAIHCLKIFWW